MYGKSRGAMATTMHILGEDSSWERIHQQQLCYPTPSVHLHLSSKPTSQHFFPQNTTSPRLPSPRPVRSPEA